MLTLLRSSISHDTDTVLFEIKTSWAVTKNGTPYLLQAMSDYLLMMYIMYTGSCYQEWTADMQPTIFLAGLHLQRL